MVVTVRIDGGDEEKFLLGARENLAEGDNLDVYSPQSALGAAINGKRKGDTVTYTAPTGKEITVEIVDAEPYQRLSHHPDHRRQPSTPPTPPCVERLSSLTAPRPQAYDAQL